MQEQNRATNMNIECENNQHTLTVVRESNPLRAKRRKRTSSPFTGSSRVHVGTAGVPVPGIVTVAGLHAGDVTPGPLPDQLSLAPHSELG